MQSGAVQSAEAPAQVYQLLKRVFHVLCKRTIGIYACNTASASRHLHETFAATRMCGACGKQHAASSLVQQYKEIATSVQ